jgi:hypothetical protein
MALQQVDSFTVTSNVANVTIGGGSSSSSGVDFAINTDEVYVVTVSNVFFDSNDDLRFRWTVSGTNDSSSNYHQSAKAKYHDATFGTSVAAGGSSLDFNQTTGTSANNAVNMVMHLYNFNNASGFSYCTVENVNRNTSQSRTGIFSGSGVLQENQATDGVYFHANSGNNIASGTFSLFKVRGS